MRPKKKQDSHVVKVVFLLLAIFVVAGVFQFTSLFQRPFPSAGAAAPSAVTNVVPSPADASVSLKWTNPASVDFTGTMVRYGTSGFPASVSDGTLAGDVAGTPSGTSSLTVNGLANGTVYYFALFSHNAASEYGTAATAQQLVMPAAFSDDFQALTVGSISGQNGWAPIGGTWSVVDTAGEKTLQSSAAFVAYEVNRALNGGNVNAYTDQMARVDWRGTTTATPGQVFLRAQSASADAGGYFLWQSGGTVRINYKTASGSTQAQLASASFTPTANVWYTYEFSVVNNSAGLPVLTGYVWQRGTAKPSVPTLQVTDTVNRFPQGVFSLGKTGTSVNDYDNVIFYGRIGVSRANVTPANLSNVISWTNPTFAGYAGTMVRASTSAYPTSPTDGTLVADVTGASGGTSSATHASLTNGATYYYTLFPYGAGPAYGSPARLIQVAYPALFTDNFNALSVGDAVGQNGWTSPGGTWAVADVSSERVLSGTNTVTTYSTNRAVNGNAETGDQILFTRFKSNTASNTAGYVWLRYQSSSAGYLVWHNANVWNISYFTSSPSTLTTIATAAAAAAPPMEANVWFNLEVSVINDGAEQPVIKAYVWRDGAEKPLAPTLQATDSTDRFPRGSFAVGRNNGAPTVHYDDVAFFGSAPPLTITSPAAEVVGAPDVATRAIVDENGTVYIPYIQTSAALNVSASAGYVPAGGGVEFVLNEGLAGEQTVVDLSSSYAASFSGLAKGEYTLDAYVLDADGVTRIPDETFHDARTDIGIGDIVTVIGDSIVEGLRGTVDGGTVTSWLDADAGTASLDNRNFPQYGNATAGYAESFLSDFNDQLAAYYGYPVFLMNEGRGGIRADTYPTSVMAGAAWQARQLALAPNRWIVALGNNDGNVGHSASAYQTNMTNLLSALVTTYGAAYENIYVPYPLYDFRPCNPGCGTAAQYIATYLPVIDGLRTSLGLAGGADLFNTFQNYQGTDYFDTVHPNAAGYVRMARLWALAFMKPVVDAPSVNGRSVTLAWNDLSAFQPTIVGYRVRYGTDPGILDGSLTVANVTTATVTNLEWGTPYYFDVTGFDDDPTDVSYTDASEVVAATTGAGASGVGVSAVSNNVTEAGVTATFTVVLQNQPTAAVTIPVSSSDVGEGTVSPASLIFGTGNWNIPQTVTVAGVNDDVDDGDVAFAVILGPAISTDVTFDGLNAEDPSLSNLDDDGAGIAVSSVSGQAVEGGAPATFTVVLVTEPTAGVTVSMAVSDGLEATVSTDTLVFGAGDWNEPQTVSVSAVNDSVHEDDETVAVAFGVDSVDVAYDGMSVAPVTVTVVSDDPSGGSSPSDPSTSSSATRELSVVRPAAGDRYEAYADLPVTWTSSGMVPFVDIYLSLDDGDQWTLVADNEVNDGFESVALSGDTSDAARVRLVGTDLATALIEDVGGAFAILPETVELPTEPAPEPATPEEESETAARFADWPAAASVGGLVKIRENSQVFYLGADGRRHSFPNEKIFFTWYCDFSSVRDMSLSDVSRIPLGENVTYRPGVRMVKITTSPMTYVVERLHIIRWVTTEAVAAVLYGNLWNTFVDDIAEAWFGNYTVGDPVSDSAEYDPQSAEESVTTPSDNMDIPGREPVPSTGLVCP